MQNNARRERAGPQVWMAGAPTKARGKLRHHLVCFRPHEGDCMSDFPVHRSRWCSKRRLRFCFLTLTRWFPECPRGSRYIKRQFLINCICPQTLSSSAPIFLLNPPYPVPDPCSTCVFAICLRSSQLLIIYPQQQGAQRCSNAATVLAGCRSCYGVHSPSSSVLSSLSER